MFRCTCVQLDGRRCHEKKGWKDEEEEVIADRIDGLGRSSAQETGDGIEKRAGSRHANSTPNLFR